MSVLKALMTVALTPIVLILMMVSRALVMLVIRVMAEIVQVTHLKVLLIAHTMYTCTSHISLFPP